MLGIGDFKANSCGGQTRRSFLQTAAALPMALGAGHEAWAAGKAVSYTHLTLPTKA